MMVSNKGNLRGLLRWQKNNVQLYAAAGTAVWLLSELFGWGNLLPTMPLAVVGAALGIFVSFRTNSAYDRWWEGRKLWGKIINSTRHWAGQITAYLPGHALSRPLIVRMVGWVHVLRCALRQQDPWTDEHVRRHISVEDVEALRGESNPAHALLAMQLREVASLGSDGELTELRVQTLDETLMDLLDWQGGCERIKKTPIPRGYGFIAEILIRYYALLLPFAIVGDLGVFTIPTNILVCLSFALISETGRVLEDPFTMFYNGLPLTQISLMLENNLLHRLGDTELPAIPGPDANGILM